MRILYIEDKPVNARVMHKIARAASCELWVATTGREGLAMLDQKPDVILTDIGLPDVDGPALICQIRQALPEVPIIVVTAHVLPIDRQRCAAAGCTDYIAKPFRFGDMVEYLNKYRAAIDA
jgi:CheY-like chemotaxis protein